MSGWNLADLRRTIQFHGSAELISSRIARAAASGSEAPVIGLPITK